MRDCIDMEVFTIMNEESGVAISPASAPIISTSGPEGDSYRVIEPESCKEQDLLLSQPSSDCSTSNSAVEHSVQASVQASEQSSWSSEAPKSAELSVLTSKAIARGFLS